MKATFLVPPCFDHKQPPERSAGCTRVVYPAPNIYELTVAAAVREIPGVEVTYIDGVHKGMTPGEFECWCSSDVSDLYFIWTVNLSIDTDLAAIRTIRKFRPDVPVIMMGPGPTYFTSKCIGGDSNVIVVRGEPDDTVCEVVELLSRGEMPDENVAGLSRLVDGKVRNNKPRELIMDLNSRPFAARDLVADHEFHNPKLKMGPYTTMFTSRNCPFHCIYCVPSSLSFAREIEYRNSHGRKPLIGFRSPESVEKEVAMLHEQGYRAIGFMDDNFIWDEKRTASICDIMRRYSMVWGCEARVDAITEPIAKMLGESGCRYVDLGVESFDDEILCYVKKGITVADIYRAVGLLKKYAVPVKLNILIGSSPLETRATVLHTLREAKKLDVDQVMFNIVSPFPGTEFYKLCKDNGWLKNDEYVPTDVQRNSILELPGISSREMERLLFLNNLRFFFSPKFIRRQLSRFRSWKEFTHAAKALKIKLFG